jgi:CRP/FNR family transcriptional regulator, cyclic AMP receptor protein
MKTIDTLIHDVPIFQGMPPEAFELLSGCASNIRFTDGEMLFREGDDANVFYVIRHGRVALDMYVPARGPMTIETLDPGEVIGWSWLFPPYRWHFDAKALGIVRATVFGGACLREKCEQDTAFGYDLMNRFAQVMIERLQWTRLRLLDVYGNDR